jgi:AcrR family transcriptional regulator
VVGTAIALADEVGLAALSMRGLAARLEVVPMALYKHVEDKEDLITGMVDQVVAGFTPPPVPSPWRAAVWARVSEARRGTQRHPWLREAVETTGRRPPAVLAYLDSFAGDLVRGGFSYDLTHYAMHALGHRVWGFSPEPFGAPTGATAPPTRDELAHAAAVYPHVMAIAQDAHRRNHGRGCNEDNEFAFTLDLLLDAFERLRDSGWSSTG